MKARPGDRIVLAGTRVDEPTRDGHIIEVRGADGSPPFVVEWADGHTGLLYPGPGAVLRIVREEDQPAGKGQEPTTFQEEEDVPHVREWSLRVSIFESGDDTTATAVLLADSPEHLTARGESHRAKGDPMVPEIGDEVAVARALRHLADKLMATAESDLEALTGEDVHIRRA